MNADANANAKNQKEKTSEIGKSCIIYVSHFSSPQVDK